MNADDGDTSDNRPLAQRRPRRHTTAAMLYTEDVTVEPNLFCLMARRRFRALQAASDDYSQAAYHMVTPETSPTEQCPHASPTSVDEETSVS